MRLGDSVMCWKTFVPWWLAAICLAASLMTPATAWCQDAAQDSQSDASADDDKTLREQTVYIPFSKLRDVFEKEGRGVFLPYDQFQTLWKAAREKNPAGVPNAADQPPVDAILVQATSEATVQADVVQVEATLEIELLRKGWNTIPLNLKNTAIQSATLGDQPARITAKADGSYQLVVKNPGQQDNRIELKLVYVRAFNKSPGQNSVSLSAPQAPVNRWKIRVPGSDAKINVSPMIAASESPASNPTATAGDADATAADDAEPNDSKPNDSKPKADETVLWAFVGAAPEVSIRWTAKSEGASGMTALTSVQTAQQTHFAEGAVRTRAQVNYSISRAQLKQLIVDVPSDQKVVNVADANIRKWDVEVQDDKQRITVELFEPAEGQQALMIELEKFIDETMMQRIETPIIEAIGVGRQQGFVVTKVDPELRMELTAREGLLQIDASELPPTLAGQKWANAFRYSALPYKLELSLEKIKPRIEIDQLVEAYLMPSRLTLESYVVFDIQQTGVFQLEMDVPSGYTIEQVVGRAQGQAQPAAVESHDVTGQNNTRLQINLSRKAIGKIGVWVQMYKTLTDPNLLTPTGNASDVQIEIPKGDQTYRSRLDGHVVVYAPESLRLNPNRNNGMRAVSFTEAFSKVQSTRDSRYSGTRPTLAFTFSDQPSDLQVNVLRRNPSVTARQLLVTDVESGVVKYRCTLFFEIRYSGVKSLRIDVPDSIADKLQNQSGGLRDSVMQPQPDDVAEGYVAWQLSAESELNGQKTVVLAWDKNIAELEVGQSVQIDVPAIVPQDVDRSWGQIVITKSETLDVQPVGQPTGLRPIDPSVDLMPGANVKDAAAAMEFHDAWTLSLAATRYQVQPMKRTSIERALVRNVLTRSGYRNVHAMYRVRSAEQRLALLLPAEAEFDSQPARINGAPVPMERGDKDQLFIPLSGQTPDDEFVLSLRYTVKGGSDDISLPEFPDQPALQKIYLAVYLPEEWTLLSSSGPWTEEFTWRRQQFTEVAPVPNQDEQRLQQWVSEGINTMQDSVFQTDGTMFLYSALRPDPPPEGNLSLTTAKQSMIGGLILTCLIVLGLLTMATRLAGKVSVLVLLGIAVAGCCVLTPNFSQHLLGLPAVSGMLVLLLVWGAWGTQHATKAVYRSIRTGWNRPAKETSAEDETAATADQTPPEPSSQDDQEDEIDEEFLIADDDNSNESNDRKEADNE